MHRGARGPLNWCLEVENISRTNIPVKDTTNTQIEVSYEGSSLRLDKGENEIILLTNHGMEYCLHKLSWCWYPNLRIQGIQEG